MEAQVKTCSTGSYQNPQKNLQVCDAGVAADTCKASNSEAPANQLTFRSVSQIKIKDIKNVHFEQISYKCHLGEAHRFSRPQWRPQPGSGNSLPSSSGRTPGSLLEKCCGSETCPRDAAEERHMGVSTQSKIIIFLTHYCVVPTLYAQHISMTCL